MERILYTGNEQKFEKNLKTRKKANTVLIFSCFAGNIFALLISGYVAFWHFSVSICVIPEILDLDKQVC